VQALDLAAQAIKHLAAECGFLEKEIQSLQSERAAYGEEGEEGL
jgi:hypothetical protein